VVDDLLVGVQEPLTGMAHRIEGPGLDQRLHGPLVQDRGVATLCEVVEVLERTVGGPLGLDQLQQAAVEVLRAFVPAPVKPTGKSFLIRECAGIRKFSPTLPTGDRLSP
jgi:hypothetical protein